MNFTGLIFLLLMQFVAGRGILQLFRLQLSAMAMGCFALMCGGCVVSFAPFIVQALGLALVAPHIYYCIAALTALCAAPLIAQRKTLTAPRFVWPKLYEAPFLAVFAILAAISVWRCFYLPMTPRDMLTGTELIAEFAVREGTLVNSVFNGLDLRMAPAHNIFKSPFMTGMQIVYKLLVQPFGQVWLSMYAVCFCAWFYSVLRLLVHPVIAGALMLLLLCAPDLFSYSYIVMYDYMSMVFFVSAFYFLSQYLESNKINELAWVSLLFGIAMYLRSETIIFQALLIPTLLYQWIKTKTSPLHIALRTGIYLAGSVAFHYTGSALMSAFIPVPLSLRGMVNTNPAEIGIVFTKAAEIAQQLIFWKKGVWIYGYLVYAFLGTLAIDIIWPRTFSKNARTALLGVAVVYAGLAFMCYFFPFIVIQNTIKRGLFRMFPLLVLYMASSGAVQRLSATLTKWATQQQKVG